MDNPCSIPTPPELIQAFQSLEGAHIPSTQALAERVSGLSDSYKCKYVSLSTGPSRVTQIFSCVHRKSIYCCPATVRFRLDFSNQIVHFESCDQNHNHNIGIPSTKRMKNNLTRAQREKIADATREGVSAYHIRLHHALTCSKDTLYNARRGEKKRQREREMNDLLLEMDSWPGWTNVVLRDETNTFCGCYCFHDRILSSDYVRDICVLDDTSCTNFYGFPLLVMLAEDEHAHNQVIAFTFMVSRLKDTFLQFFQEVRKRVGVIRLFVSDRHKSQISAIQTVWPEALVMYCCVHIGRNIRQVLGNDMFSLYQKLRTLQITETMFITALTEYSQANPDTRGSKFVVKLLSEQDHWLPSIVQTYIHCDNATTNRVEGFFGSLKNLIEHELQTFPMLVRAVYLRAERLFIASANEKHVTVPPELLSDNDAQAIGVFPLTLMLSEYVDLREKGALNVPYGHDCCKNHMFFNLPCRHLMLERLREDKLPLLSLEDIPARWRRSLVKPSKPASTEFSRPVPEEHSWGFNSCMARFERYFSAASRSQSIQKVLDTALNNLKTIEHESTPGDEDLLPPPSLLLPGRASTHPRRHVDLSGAPRKKRQYHCSICGQSNHTAPRCPQALNKS